MNVSVTAASKSVSSLEDALGIALFEREKNRIRLNQYGKALVNHAKVILSEVEAAKRQLTAMKASRESTVRINVPPAIVPRLLPEAIHKLRLEYPESTVKFAGNLVGSFSQFKLEELANDRYDILICIIDDVEDLSAFHHEKLVEIKLRVMASKNHPALEIKNPTLAKLRDFDWIAPSLEGTPNRVFRQTFHDNDVKIPNNIMSVPTREMMFSLLAQGGYIAMVPYHRALITEGFTAAEYIDIAGLNHGWCQHIVTRRGSVRGKYVERFIELLHELVDTA